MKKLLLNEPAVTLSALLAVVVAAIALLQAFGVPISDGQQAALVGFVGAVGALVVGLVTRSLVTPTVKVDEAVAAATSGEVPVDPEV